MALTTVTSSLDNRGRIVIQGYVTSVKHKHRMTLICQCHLKLCAPVVKRFV